MAKSPVTEEQLLREMKGRGFSRSEAMQGLSRFRAMKAQPAQEPEKKEKYSGVIEGIDKVESAISKFAPPAKFIKDVGVGIGTAVRKASDSASRRGAELREERGIVGGASQIAEESFSGLLKGTGKGFSDIAVGVPTISGQLLAEGEASVRGLLQGALATSEQRQQAMAGAKQRSRDIGQFRRDLQGESGTRKIFKPNTDIEKTFSTIGEFGAQLGTAAGLASAIPTTTRLGAGLAEAGIDVALSSATDASPEEATATALLSGAIGAAVGPTGRAAKKITDATIDAETDALLSSTAKNVPPESTSSAQEVPRIDSRAVDEFTPEFGKIEDLILPQAAGDLPLASADGIRLTLNLADSISKSAGKEARKIVSSVEDSLGRNLNEMTTNELSTIARELSNSISGRLTKIRDSILKTAPERGILGKGKSFLRGFTQESRSALNAAGPEGRKIAKEIDTAGIKAKTMEKIHLKEYKENILSLPKDVQKNFGDYVEERLKPETPEIEQAVNWARQFFIRADEAMKRQGVIFRTRESFFPHLLTKKMQDLGAAAIKNRNEAKKLAKYMAEQAQAAKKQGRNIEDLDLDSEVRKVVNYFRNKRALADKTIEGRKRVQIERFERTSPEFHEIFRSKDATKAFPNYIDGMARRLQLAKAFGPNNERLWGTLYETIAKDPKRAKELIGAMEAIMDGPDFNRAMSFMAAGNTILKIGPLTALQNLTEVSNTATFVGFRNTIKGIFDAITQESSSPQIMELGAARQRAAGRSSAVQKWLGSVGFNITDISSAKVSDKAAVSYTEGIVREVRKNPENWMAQRRLIDVVGPDNYAYAVKNGIRETPLEQLVEVKQIGKTKPVSDADMPRLWKSPIVRTMNAFRSYSVRIASSVFNEVRTAVEREEYASAGSIMARFAIASTLAGVSYQYMIELSKSFFAMAKGEERDMKSLEDMFADAVWNQVRMLGAPVGFDIFSSMGEFGDFSSGGELASLGGPVAGITAVGADIAGDLYRLIEEQGKDIPEGEFSIEKAKDDSIDFIKNSLRSMSRQASSPIRGTLEAVDKAIGTNLLESKSAQKKRESLENYSPEVRKLLQGL